MNIKALFTPYTCPGKKFIVGNMQPAKSKAFFLHYSKISTGYVPGFARGNTIAFITVL